MENSTTVGILEFGTFHGNQHFLLVPGTQPFTVYLLELLSTGTELVKGTGWELSSWLQKTHNHVRVFRVVFGDIMLSCETWLVLHAKERWGTSNLTGNGCEQWTTTDLVHCHPFWLAAVRVGMFWQLISHLYIREMETEWEKDCLKPIIKTHPVIQIWSFLLILNG